MDTSNVSFLFSFIRSFLAVLGTEPRALGMLGKHSTAELLHTLMTYTLKKVHTQYSIMERKVPMTNKALF